MSKVLSSSRNPAASAWNSCGTAIAPASTLPEIRAVKMTSDAPIAGSCTSSNLRPSFDSRTRVWKSVVVPPAIGAHDLAFEISGRADGGLHGQRELRVVEDGADVHQIEVAVEIGRDDGRWRL